MVILIGENDKLLSGNSLSAEEFYALAALRNRGWRFRIGSGRWMGELSEDERNLWLEYLIHELPSRIKEIRTDFLTNKQDLTHQKEINTWWEMPGGGLIPVVSPRDTD